MIDYDGINEWELHMARVQFYAHLEEALDNHHQLMDYFNRGLELLDSIDKLTGYERWYDAQNKMITTYPVYHRNCVFTFSNRINTYKYAGVPPGEGYNWMNCNKRFNGFRTIPRRVYTDTVNNIRVSLHKYIGGDGYQ